MLQSPPLGCLYKLQEWVFFPFFLKAQLQTSDKLLAAPSQAQWWRADRASISFALSSTLVNFESITFF